MTTQRQPTVTGTDEGATVGFKIVGHQKPFTARLRKGMAMGAIVKGADRKTVVRQMGTITSTSDSGFIVRLDDGSEIEIWR